MSLCAAHVEFRNHCISCATVRCSVPPIGKGYGSICNISPVCLSVCLSVCLTIWSRVLLEKPLLQLAKQIAAFCHPKVHYRVHKRPSLATVFRSVQSTPPSHFMKNRLNISPLNGYVTQVVFLPQISPPKACNAPLLSPPPFRATCPAYLILRDWITRTIIGDECSL